MKKFERLPAEERKNEIKQSALKLFLEKGFASTTMENIVSNTTLSKGGVYRIYPSTSAILSDLIIDGMHMRNLYYEEFVRKLEKNGETLDFKTLVHMIGSSLLMSPEISRIYVEFLWEKQRNEALESLYGSIEERTVIETNELIRKHGLSSVLPEHSSILKSLQDMMNSAILSMHTLSLFDYYQAHQEDFENAIVSILEKEYGK